MTDSSPSAFHLSPSGSPFAFRPSPLPSDLRNKLERVVIEARDAAEVGARAALEALAVHHHEPYPHMKPAQRELRNHLRARARQLGDQQDKTGRIAIQRIVHECAYEHWHRMLFARFLAENNLLIEPDSGMAITLEEAEELAEEERRKEQGEGRTDAASDSAFRLSPSAFNKWVYASRCAQRMLPQIFRPDDPLLQVSFATEHMLKLEKLLASLPAAVFTASDALGWVYQFWQSKKKDEVNRSEVKIGADELPVVTQLFTEPYMVEFLLHNTLGAWWAGKRLKEQGERSKEESERRKKEWEACKTEEDCRRLLALPGVTWDYLRFVRIEDIAKAVAQGEKDTSPSAFHLPPSVSAFRLSPSAFFPAAGTFDGWPRAAREIKVLDPCCGSGHFLVAGLHHLVPIRMAEEGLSAADAVDAVLRDNLHGLEIDERCCQIAAFALALAAWTYPDTGGYRELPELHIACSGIGPQCSAEEWVKLAEKAPSAFRLSPSAFGSEAIRNGLLNLHRLFSQAPTLGSLINPAELPADLIAADYETIQPYLTAIRSVEKADDETRERAIAAAGMVKAADLLAGDYTLVITNVPYLGRNRQNDVLKEHLGSRFTDGKADIATAFVLRGEQLCANGGAISLVTPQNWLFLSRYDDLRKNLLRRASFEWVARLGEHGFDSPQAAGAFTALSCITCAKPKADHTFAGIDVGDLPSAAAKAEALRLAEPNILLQAEQQKNPDARVVLEHMKRGEYLQERANSWQGIKTSDDARFTRAFWEHKCISDGWTLYQRAPDGHKLYSGREETVFWEDGHGSLTTVCQAGASFRGQSAWGRNGVAVSMMRGLPATIYTGEKFSADISIIDPIDQSHLAALWAFCTSGEYLEEVRKIDKALRVTNTAMAKVPFDLAHWQKVAEKKFPDGVPEPESDNPTQWLFHGHPYEANEDAMLQVAVARLLGYRWPAELEEKAEGGRRKAEEGGMRLSKRARELVKKCEELLPFADEDGIVCIPAVRGEEPAAERLLKLLAACDIELESDFDLDDWLRSAFFEEHCKLFHDRPFVWHIWDGRKRDGFHALVNYHKLCEQGEGRKAKGEEEKAKGERRKAEGHAGRRLLESLTYAYLGEWITRQRDGVKRGEGGAEDRLAAALELQKRLEAILAGEPPFDIFVRWKPLAEQPIGWEPDINDGVRMNIRPFLASDLPGGKKGAGILRCKPNVKWTKDRGKEPERPKDEYPWFWGWDGKTVDFMGGKKFDGNRWNALHYSNALKQTAREQMRTT